MGESDESVAPLDDQIEAIRPFLPKDVPFRPLLVPGKSPRTSRGLLGSVECARIVALGLMRAA